MYRIHFVIIKKCVSNSFGDCERVCIRIVSCTMCCVFSGAGRFGRVPRSQHPGQGPSQRGQGGGQALQAALQGERAPRKREAQREGMLVFLPSAAVAARSLFVCLSVPSSWCVGPARAGFAGSGIRFFIFITRFDTALTVPCLPCRGERFVLRSVRQTVTIGGGVLYSSTKCVGYLYMFWRLSFGFACK